MKFAAFGENDRAFNHVLQFAHVARPIVAPQILHQKSGQARTGDPEASGSLLNKVIGKFVHIFEAFAQRGDLAGPSVPEVRCRAKWGRLMFTVGLLSMLMGIALGMRFRVLILFPAMAL